MRVEYKDGSHYHCRPQKLMPDFVMLGRQRGLKKPVLVVCRETDMYRRTALTQCSENDVCIEIGCDFGYTTHLLSTRCRMAYGIDKQEDHVAKASETYKNNSTQFLAGDIFTDTAMLLEQLSAETGGSVRIWLDLNGNRELEAVQRAIKLLASSALSPDLIVVKSRALYSLKKE